ncbi:beta-N-acetylhexosaminidase [Kordiimonas sediminis]|uniref:beta-N-acetylhexosaminidase n=1 Tax=Kordiimonas sediminis TaxID=1735581 RepID=A0A919E4S3_9PROT|nr:family 20 glycosylhydrolase [Kordiimonas sediminis]GHF13770.1 beta-N-acetylhexosaminidase [Kordiimonas sediminis]
MLGKTACIIALMVLAAGCTDQSVRDTGAEKDGVSGQHASAHPLSVIPLPEDIAYEAGKPFQVTNAWRIGGHNETVTAFKRIMENSPFDFQPDTTDTPEILFQLAETGLGYEGYKLEARDGKITVEADAAAGLYYGAVTLWQILTPLNGTEVVTLTPMTITDRPRFGWRGLMLDEGRHFQGEDFVKRMLDWMSLHKFNRFQWHLVDDQGWRLEIKKYPELTAKGAWRVPAGAASRANIDPETGEPKKIGGFYTQEQIRDIVAYAAERHIMIIPEIGLPGHSQAPTAVYPQFGMFDAPRAVSADWGIFKDTYNLEDHTFAYLEDVLREVMDLFPSPYVHIGGDEVQKDLWANDPRTQELMADKGIKDVEEIQSYFTRHFDGFLNEHGRTLIGWDEILEGGDIHQSSIVMSWRGEAGGIEAAKEGHEVIMSPWPMMYLDMHQSLSTREPTGRPDRTSLVPLKRLYDYDPVPNELTPDQVALIKGAQGNIWTEHMRTNDHVMHMTFPRASAIAETVWSRRDKDFDGFVGRLPAQLARYDSLGIRYADVAFEVQADIVELADGQRQITLSNQLAAGNIRYTLDGTEVTADSDLYTAPVVVDATDQLQASTFVDGRMLSAPTERGLDQISVRTRTDDQLAVCESGYHLKLDDDYPYTGPRAAFSLNILNPCWIYKDVNLEGIRTVDLTVGTIPFNFQIGDDWKKVTFDQPQTEHGELNIYANQCTGAPVVSVSLAPVQSSFGLVDLSAELPAGLAAEALCFRFARPAFDPAGGEEMLYTLDKVVLR